MDAHAALMNVVIAGGGNRWRNDDAAGLVVSGLAELMDRQLAA